MDDINLIHKDFREMSAMAFYNNILWWADGNQEVDKDTLDKAFKVLDKIIMKDYKSEFVVKCSRGTIFYRARNIEPQDYTRKDKGITYSDKRLYGFNWDESKEPPLKYATDGRTSKKDDCALYLAYDEITACMEVRPQIKQLVSVAQFELQNDIEIIDFSKLQYSQSLDKYDEENDVDVRHFLQKIFALFTRPIYDHNYVVTQKIVDHFREYGFQGIAYRSLYTGRANYTFFDELKKEFTWKDSRVLINYSVSNLFVTMDEIDGCEDISNIEEIEKVVSERVRKDMLKNTKNLFAHGAENRNDKRRPAMKSQA